MKDHKRLLSNTIGYRSMGFIAALFGLTGVALGAFGAHGLEGHLSPERMATFETGVQYQVYHALALLVVAVSRIRRDQGPLKLAGWAFVVGILLFSGSLYLLVFTGATWFGAVTPLGGVGFLVGWGSLAWAFFRPHEPAPDHRPGERP
jgi:uncharacterized membrane protein YgdD (TMEM256/DUF423 family)